MAHAAQIMSRLFLRILTCAIVFFPIGAASSSPQKSCTSELTQASSARSAGLDNCIYKKKTPNLDALILEARAGNVSSAYTVSNSYHEIIPRCAIIMRNGCSYKNLKKSKEKFEVYYFSINLSLRKQKCSQLYDHIINITNVSGAYVNRHQSKSIAERVEELRCKPAQKFNEFLKLAPFKSAI